MNTNIDRYRSKEFFQPAEHGGGNVKGGRPQSAPESGGEEQIQDALGQSTTGHGKTAGTADPGVPGSRTNPVHEKAKGKNEEEQTESGKMPKGRGTAAGS